MSFRNPFEYNRVILRLGGNGLCHRPRLLLIFVARFPPGPYLSFWSEGGSNTASIFLLRRWNRQWQKQFSVGRGRLLPGLTIAYQRVRMRSSSWGTWLGYVTLEYSITGDNVVWWVPLVVVASRLLLANATCMVNVQEAVAIQTVMHFEDSNTAYLFSESCLLIRTRTRAMMRTAGGTAIHSPRVI